MAQSYLPNYYQLENGNHHQQESKPAWKYQSCECCPYGYHIDLDFVRYCEALKERANYTGSINKRRERRRQRQSMEVLLGLTTTPTISFATFPRTAEHVTLPHYSRSNAEEPNLRRSTSQIQSTLVQDALGDVVTDFERVLERSNGTSGDVSTFDALYRVSSNSSMSSGCGSAANVNAANVNGVINDIDSAKGLSADALKNIRKQMALGLERMRELEEQVKIIPSLQVQVSVLKDDKRKLVEQIRQQNDLVMRRIPESAQKPQTFVARRDVAVMCGIISRTIGVGPQYPRMRTVSTTTETVTVPLKNVPSVLSKSSQTLSLRIRDAEIQTDAKPVKRCFSVGVNAKPEMLDFSLQNTPKIKTVGVSNDSIKDTFCDRCSALTRTIGVGPAVDAENPSYLSLQSLQSLSLPRSKSFNLGEEKLGLNSKLRTIGCQSENMTVTRACQYEPKVQTRWCQYEPIRKLIHKGIQYETTGVCSQQTDTVGLRPRGKDAICNTFTPIMVDAFSNTPKLKVRDASFNTVKPTLTTTSSGAVEVVPYFEDGKKEDNPVMVSRIPRPFQSPLTERRKLRRQDTYTKIPAPSSELSGIDLSPTTSQPTITVASASTNISKSKSKHDIARNTNDDASSPQSTQASHVYSLEKKHEQSNVSLPLSEPALLSSIDRSTRRKAVPSKEMQGAMKVLNDSLQKSTQNGSAMSAASKSHLKNALNIIQKEWFKVSSLINANPLDVEDYLDRFEEMSSVLLQYIVNMTDDSGNTAMHYAVSHGNFDVVSILLDSKVCNINKPNKAGYTSVMLLSLTKVRSPTYATVVRRLFQLADVNVRASQHGQTALMLAVSHGRLDMVQMLLEAGADINIQDEDGSTALMCAAEHGHIDIVKYFLSHPECDSSIVDVDGSTALKIALEAGHKDIGVLLYAHEHSVHGISPYSSLKQRKSKSASNSASSSNATSRSPSHLYTTFDNKSGTK